MLPKLENVEAIIREVAETIILPRFYALRSAQISKKKSGEIVTIADIEAEKFLEAKLLNFFPGSNCIGEEAYEENPIIIKRLLGDQPTWIIDPIDGTSNFAAGKKKFATIIALAIKTEIVAGWIYDPNKSFCCISEKGSGAWIGEKRLIIKAPRKQNVWRGSLSNKFSLKLVQSQKIDIQGKNLTRYRCVGLEYIDLVRNNMQFARYGGAIKPWDHAAGILIHQEAGGISKDVQTGRLYSVKRGICLQSILMTPDNRSWKQLSKLLK